MKFGLQINPYTSDANGNPWPFVAQAARLLDQSAFDSLWIYDHFLYEGGYPGHPYQEPVLECFTTLGAIAAITSRIRMGQLVVGVPYRNPAMLAKMATTLDLISGGRSILGIGAGWHQREHEAYGWGEFEPGPVRLKRLEEALRLILALWTEDRPSFKGQFYELQELTDSPKPVQSAGGGHPPIMVGGSGEKVTLRIAAQYAQIANVNGAQDPAGARRLYGALREHCQRLGRPYDEVTRSVYLTILLGRDEADVAAKRERFGAFLPRGSLVGTPAQVVDMLAEYEAAGCQYAIFRMPDWFELDGIRLFSEAVIPALPDESR